VVWLSTPSRLDNEKTLLALAPCPRHNIIGSNNLDYGDLNYKQDTYFDRYGGYDCFRAFICAQEKIYELLGCEKFLSKEEADTAFESLQRHLAMKPVNEDAFREYFLEVNKELRKHGFSLPAEIIQVLDEDDIRKKTKRPNHFGSILSDEMDLVTLKDAMRELSDAPFMRELREILDGKYSGRPHWALDT
jgi:hypothetical protein